MEKYLYLTKTEWADIWVNGGDIPINLASSYLSSEREGIKTPDENLIYDSPVNLDSLPPGLVIEPGARLRNVTIVGNSVDGMLTPDALGINRYSEDGLILSFCNTFDQHIASRLGKRACVKILNIQQLKDCIDEQLGCVSRMICCEYTSDHQRNHFLKSVDDAWQDEFRLFWPLSRKQWVTIPRGLSKLVGTFPVPPLCV